MSKDRKTEDKAQSKEVELIFNSYDGRLIASVQFPWRNSINRIAVQHKFYDAVLSLAELPGEERLPEILATSQQANINVSWHRVGPSPLETNTTALLTALAFSSREHRLDIIAEFFEAFGLTVDLRGRPHADPKTTTVIVRGIQIDQAMRRLKRGFEVTHQARRIARFGSDDAEIAISLKKQGYDELEVQAMLGGKTLQDAACRYIIETTDLKGKRGALKIARNCIAQYKHMRAKQAVP
jgi:hypothetical protein